MHRTDSNPKNYVKWQIAQMHLESRVPVGGKIAEHASGPLGQLRYWFPKYFICRATCNVKYFAEDTIPCLQYQLTDVCIVTLGTFGTEGLSQGYWMISIPFFLFLQGEDINSLKAFPIRFYQMSPLNMYGVAMPSVSYDS